MYQVARALRDANFNGVMIPDHVPAEGLRGVNTACTIGYMRAMRQRVKGG